VQLYCYLGELRQTAGNEGIRWQITRKPRLLRRLRRQRNVRPNGKEEEKRER
jgi:hypothetical protein